MYLCIYKQTIHFLDLNISLDNDGTIVTWVFQKRTATNSFLHWESYHPISLCLGIPIGQYLHVRRNCTDEEGFELYSRFQARGYPKKVLHQAYYRAKTPPREPLLMKKETRSNKQIRCVGTYDGNNARIKQIFF